MGQVRLQGLGRPLGRGGVQGNGAVNRMCFPRPFPTRAVDLHSLEPHGTSLGKCVLVCLGRCNEAPQTWVGGAGSDNTCSGRPPPWL